jgi:hypothetical protein
MYGDAMSIVVANDDLFVDPMTVAVFLITTFSVRFG